MIERLEDLDLFQEVRIVTQPAWPLQFQLQRLFIRCFRATTDDPENDDLPAQDVVYLVEGGHPEEDTSYGPRWVFDAI